MAVDRIGYALLPVTLIGSTVIRTAQGYIEIDINACFTNLLNFARIIICNDNKC